MPIDDDTVGGISKLLHQSLLFLFPKNCFEEIVLNFNVLHGECAPLVLSRFLGVAITLGSLMLFVPQIIKIWRASSGAGISLSSQLLSLLASGATAGYSYQSNFVFSQWGDALFVSIQLIIIIMQMMYYAGHAQWSAGFLAFVWMIAMAVYTGYVPFWILTALQTFTIPIVVIAKGIQVHANWRNRSTGELSVISVFLAFAGTLARIFTSMQETNDRLMVVSYAAAAFMNALLFTQMIIYWQNVVKHKRH